MISKRVVQINMFTHYQHLRLIFTFQNSYQTGGRVVDDNKAMTANVMALYVKPLIGQRIVYFSSNWLFVCFCLFVLLCLTPLSAIFQLYHGDQFQQWRKPEYLERTTEHGQATGKLNHLRLRVECTLFVIYKAGHEPTPYW